MKRKDREWRVGVVSQDGRSTYVACRDAASALEEAAGFSDQTTTWIEARPLVPWERVELRACARLNCDEMVPLERRCGAIYCSDGCAHAETQRTYRKRKTVAVAWTCPECGRVNGCEHLPTVERPA